MRYLQVKDGRISKEKELDMRKPPLRTKRETALLLASIGEDKQRVQDMLKRNGI